MTASVRIACGTRVARDAAGVGAFVFRFCGGGWYVPNSSSNARKWEDRRAPARGDVLR